MHYTLNLCFIIALLTACQSSSPIQSAKPALTPSVASQSTPTLAPTLIPIAGITPTSTPIPPTAPSLPTLTAHESGLATAVANATAMAPTSTPVLAMPSEARTTLAGLPCAMPATAYPTVTPVPPGFDPDATVEPEVPGTTELEVPATVEPPAPNQPDDSVDAIFIQDQYAYINTGSNLVILDLSDPTHPVTLGSAALPPKTGVSAIYVLDQYAYVAAAEVGLRIYDVSDPAQPAEVGCYQPPLRAWTGYTTMTSPPPPPHRAMDVVVLRAETGRTYAYMAANTAGLRIVDVSEPAAPVEVGVYEYEQPAEATAIVVVGKLAYLATGQGGLRVMDVSQPTRPVEIGALAEYNESWDVAVAGNRVYLAEGYCSSLDGCVFGGLGVVDVSNPAKPGRIGQSNSGYSQSLALVGDEIYVVRGNVLDIFRQTDLSQSVGHWQCECGFIEIAVKDEYVYLAGGEGLKILNVAEATAPTKVGEFPPVSKAQNSQWKTYTLEDGLLGGSVTDILIDEVGRKWIGMVGGVSIFDGQTWQTYTSANGLADIYVGALAHDDAGHIWVGYSNPDSPVSLSMFDGQNWQHDPTVNDIVSDIAIDSAGPIWLSTGGGLARFDDQKWNFYRFTEAAINTIAVDSVGQVWVGTWAGLNVFDGQRWNRYTLPNSGADQHIQDIAIDSSTGQVWIASAGGAVSVFDGQSWTHYTPADGLVSNMVYAIAIDSAGRKWFGTDAGVSVFDGETWTTYTTANGLAYDFVQAIAIDPVGHVWFGTSTGVVSEFIP